MQALIKFVIGFLLIAFLVTGSLAAEEKTSKQVLILSSDSFSGYRFFGGRREDIEASSNSCLL